MVTIKQIAKEAGVSKSTVSRYLNKGYVSEATAQKIEKIIAEHNYSPNEFARNLKIQKSNFIGVITPRLTSPSIMAMLNGIDEVARKNGFQMLISNTELAVQREIENIYSLVQNKVAGIILFATEITKEHIEVAKAIDIPLLFVGQSDEAVYSVDHDNYQAGVDLATSLLPYGHQNVLYIGVPENDISVGVQRKRGVVSTFTAHQIMPETVMSTFYPEDNYRLGLELLPQKKASLIVCATDNMAMGLIKAAHQLDISIGEELSVAGFGGYSFGEYLYPPLTTVDFHHQAVGEKAALLMDELLQGHVIPRRTTIETTPIIRNSVCAVKK